jgi:hypothetical protein
MAEREFTERRSNAYLPLTARTVEPAGSAEPPRPSAIVLANSVTTIKDQWELCYNHYLMQFQQAPIALKGTDMDPLISRLKSLENLAAVTHVPLVSVITTMWNSEANIYAAAMSILQQTWSSIELIIVDDASTDGTWQILQDLAADHGNVRLMQNVVNVGPYVSKNMALQRARGRYVTGHDADDWAHPQRIELQMRPILESFGRVRATITHCVRISDNLRTTIHSRIINREPEFRWSSLDGVLHTALVSLLVDRQWMLENVSAWDSVAYGADAEMLHRIGTMVSQAGLVSVHAVGMFCIAHENSLSHRGGGYESPTSLRNVYKQAYADWHDTVRTTGSAFMPFPPPDASCVRVTPSRLVRRSW